MSATAVPNSKPTILTGRAAESALQARFGVDGPLVMHAMALALAFAHGRRSALDIKQTRGAARYNAVGVAAREVILPSGYDLTTTLPRILTCQQRDIAIALYFGDEHTGDPSVSPSNAYAKGDSMHEMVQQNQGLLFPNLPLSSRPKPADADVDPDTKLAVWVLLIRVEGKMLRAEFSLPLGEDSRGFIRSWKERLILTEEEVPFGSTSVEAPEPQPSGPVFDIPVKDR